MLKHICMECGSHYGVDVATLMCMKCRQKISTIPKPKNYFNYGTALEHLKEGRKVSIITWPEGVYVELENHNFKILLLINETKQESTVFIPSVENQLDDDWYVVK